MKTTIATKDSWSTTPMSPKCAALTIDLRLSQEEFERIKQGSIPEQMEDKWFVFYENEWLYFHRSWTGYCIYQLRFQEESNTIILVEGWVTRDKAQYGGNDLEADQEKVLLLLSHLFDIHTKQPQ